MVGGEWSGFWYRGWWSESVLESVLGGFGGNDGFGGFGGFDGNGGV